MAAIADISGDAAAADNLDTKSEPESKFNVQKLVDKFTKSNPFVKEFVPSTYAHHDHQSHLHNFPVDTKPSANDNYTNNRRRKNNYNQGRRRLNGRELRAQREDNTRRTVNVSDIDQPN